MLLSIPATHGLLIPTTTRTQAINAIYDSIKRHIHGHFLRPLTQWLEKP